MKITKIVQEDIADKIDTHYIMERLGHIENVGITYICTRDSRDEDDWVDEDGTRQIVIKLSYDEVKHSKDIRPIMLKMAQERLSMAA